MTFPPHGAIIYRNEAGEPTGYDVPSDDPAYDSAYWCDDCGVTHGGPCPDPDDDDDDLEEGDDELEDPEHYAMSREATDTSDPYDKEYDIP